VEIHVVQGERPMVADNKSLGRFILDGLPPAPRGIPQIEVTFDIDANGILHVTATDKATGKEQSMKIMPSSGLSDSEIDQMVTDAERHQEEDAQQKQRIETRNQADNLVFGAEKVLSEQADKIPDDIKADVEGKIEATKKALEGDDIEAISQASAELGQAVQQIGQSMYGDGDPAAAAAGDPGAGPAPDGDADSGASDEDVVEGEFSEAEE
jgi:molecular chaperone DnaK